MGKAEAGSAKSIANAIKAKGLGRLRWYCQICEKQCRDENGFQAHCRSEPHMRKILLVGPKAGGAISEFSNQFQKEFVTLLRTRHQTNRVRANAVYNEYIQDKHHVHMNATRWVTLSGFIATLGKAGTVKVDEDDKGLWITWVDNSPHTLAKQAALQKRERAEMDGEERERKVLADQIARAKAQSEAENGPADNQTIGLQKKVGEKISLNLFQPQVEDTKPELGEGSSAGESSTSPPDGATAPIKTGISFGSFGAVTTPRPSVAINVNPLKRPAPVNVFKSAKVPKVESGDQAEDKESSNGKKGGGHGYISEAERLMKEDQARRARHGQGHGYKGFGPSRGGGG